MIIAVTRFGSDVEVYARCDDFSPTNAWVHIRYLEDGVTRDANLADLRADANLWELAETLPPCGMMHDTVEPRT